MCLMRLQRTRGMVLRTRLKWLVLLMYVHSLLPTIRSKEVVVDTFSLYLSLSFSSRSTRYPCTRVYAHRSNISYDHFFTNKEKAASSTPTLLSLVRLYPLFSFCCHFPFRQSFIGSIPLRTIRNLHYPLPEFFVDGSRGSFLLSSEAFSNGLDSASPTSSFPRLEISLGSAT